MKKKKEVNNDEQKELSEKNVFSKNKVLLSEFLVEGGGIVFRDKLSSPLPILGSPGRNLAINVGGH